MFQRVHYVTLAIFCSAQQFVLDALHEGVGTQVSPAQHEALRKSLDAKGRKICCKEKKKALNHRCFFGPKEAMQRIRQIMMLQSIKNMCIQQKKTLRGKRMHIEGIK